MATKKKRLTRAKAQMAAEALANLLEGTDHDDRLPAIMRERLWSAAVDAKALAARLAADERSLRDIY